MCHPRHHKREGPFREGSHSDIPGRDTLILEILVAKVRGGAAVGGGEGAGEHPFDKAVLPGGEGPDGKFDEDFVPTLFQPDRDRRPSGSIGIPKKFLVISQFRVNFPLRGRNLGTIDPKPAMPIIPGSLRRKGIPLGTAVVLGFEEEADRARQRQL
mgnify:CR=1 FL=1